MSVPLHLSHDKNVDLLSGLLQIVCSLMVMAVTKLNFTCFQFRNSRLMAHEKLPCISGPIHFDLGLEIAGLLLSARLPTGSVYLCMSRCCDNYKNKLETFSTST